MIIGWSKARRQKVTGPGWPNGLLTGAQPPTNRRPADPSVVRSVTQKRWFLNHAAVKAFELSQSLLKKWFEADYTARRRIRETSVWPFYAIRFVKGDSLKDIRSQSDDLIKQHVGNFGSPSSSPP